MLKMIRFLLVALGMICSCHTAYCWEISYEGNVMPNDPVLGSGVWRVYSGCDLSQTWSDGEVLHLIDPWTDKEVRFSREAVAIPAGTPITMEARLRIASGTTPGSGLAPAFMGASTWRLAGGFASAWLWSDKMSVLNADGWFHYDTDLTQFRTIRIAMNEQNYFWVWLDETEIFSGLAVDAWQNGITFGSSYYEATLESYWDYVCYSKEFVPVPEPSSLLALASGLLGLGGLALRRRRE